MAGSHCFFLSPRPLLPSPPSFLPGGGAMADGQILPREGRIRMFVCWICALPGLTVACSPHVGAGLLLLTWPGGRG